MTDISLGSTFKHRTCKIENKIGVQHNVIYIGRGSPHRKFHQVNSLNEFPWVFCGGFIPPVTSKDTDLPLELEVLILLWWVILDPHLSRQDPERSPRTKSSLSVSVPNSDS